MARSAPTAGSSRRGRSSGRPSRAPARSARPPAAPPDFELPGNGDVTTKDFTLADMVERIRQVGDLWAPMADHGSGIELEPLLDRLGARR